MVSCAPIGNRRFTVCFTGVRGGLPTRRRLPTCPTFRRLQPAPQELALRLAVDIGGCGGASVHSGLVLVDRQTRPLSDGCRRYEIPRECVSRYRRLRHRAAFLLQPDMGVRRSGILSP